MNSKFEGIVENMKKGPAISMAVINEVLERIDFSLPEDYIEFISRYNGVEGVIGSNYLQILKVEELLNENERNEVDKYAPGHFIFGSDLGGMAYAFNKETLNVVSFEFIGMLISDPPIFMGESFTAFLTGLYQS